MTPMKKQLLLKISFGLLLFVGLLSISSIGIAAFVEDRLVPDLHPTEEELNLIEFQGSQDGLWFVGYFMLTICQAIT